MWLQKFDICMCMRCRSKYNHTFRRFGNDLDLVNAESLNMD